MIEIDNAENYSGTFNIYGKKLKVRTDSKPIFLAIKNMYLPCFFCFKNANLYDFVIDIYLKDKLPFSSRVKKENSNFCSKRFKPRKDIFFIEKDKRFYFAANLGFCVWDLGSAVIFLNEAHSCDQSLIKYLFYTVFFDWMYLRGFWLVHGCGLKSGSKGTLLLGVSKSGKSNLAFKSLSKGAHCLGDNALFLKEEKRGYYIYSFLRYISLTREDALKYKPCRQLIKSGRFIIRKRDKISFEVDDILANKSAKRARLNEVVLLGQKKSAKPIHPRYLEKFLYKSTHMFMLGGLYPNKVVDMKRFARDCSARIGVFSSMLKWYK